MLRIPKESERQPASLYQCREHLDNDPRARRASHVMRTRSGVLEKIGMCWKLSWGERKIEMVVERRSAFKKSCLFSRL
jgi:hypothetical protein